MAIVSTKNGVQTVQLTSWKRLEAEVRNDLKKRPRWVYRGQSDPSWDLSSSLARELRKHDWSDSLVEQIVERHLLNFKAAARGRRGASPQEIDFVDWWGLGRHHGLATPLLDWTKSPFVALFFAFEGKQDIDSKDEQVAVFALDIGAVDQIRIRDDFDGKTDEDRTLGIVESTADENQLVVSQAAAFTYLKPFDWSIESFLQAHKLKNGTRVVVRKFLVPCSERSDCLRWLNMMNINHATLFPDLNGAAEYSNMCLREYDRPPKDQRWLLGPKAG